MAMSSEDAQFARGELERIFIDDDTVLDLCRNRPGLFLPDGVAAVPTLCARIAAALHDKIPISILRVGNGEGNAMSMLKGALHPLQASTFEMEFVSQNGISVPQADAIDFCAQVRAALFDADVIGFRSFRWSEHPAIVKFIEGDNIWAALGILYARELLQQGLAEGYWRDGIITSAWLHLDIIPHLATIFDAAESIVMITGRSELREEASARLGKRLESFITVPVQGFRPQSPQQSHFYDAFPAVMRHLDRDLSGKLVLVGAGLFGKVYCHAAKRNGAVALDLGSAFDVFAGVVTRPVHAFYDMAALRWVHPPVPSA